MISYFTTRFFYYSSIFIGIIIFSFALFHIIPSDPARVILGPNAEEGQVNQLREKLGLNEPVYVQLGLYFRNVAKLDFGHSYVDERNVFKEVWNRFKITLSLITICLILIFLYLAIVIVSLITPLRRWTDPFDFLISSLPIFFSGIIIALLSIHFYPISSFSGTFSFDDFIYLIPPALVLAFYPMAILSGILKKELSSVLSSPYIVAGRAWGFSELILLSKYALRNTIIPTLSALSNILPMFLTGAFIIEIIFSIPGIGRLLISAILNRDFPMLECTVIINGAFFVLINLVFEYIYPLLDPRVVRRHKR
jgi:peptide/nickel transport system permease protein